MLIPPGLLDTLFTGFLLGSLYALMSMGLSVIWATTGLINWAHGALITLGGYVSWYVYTSEMFGANFGAALVTALAMLFVTGMILEWVVFRPIRAQPDWQLRSILATLGITLVITYLLVFAFGPRIKKVPPVLEGTQPLIGELVVPRQSLLIFLVAVLSLLVFSIYVKNSKLGMAMRAISQDMDGARIVGINTGRVYAYTLAIGTAMAGLTGVLLGAIYFVSPTLGNEPLFKGFIVIVFGGMGSVKGTLSAAFIVGILEALVQYFISPFWVLAVLFIFMTVVLIFRPYGIAGTKEMVT